MLVQALTRDRRLRFGTLRIDGPVLSGSSTMPTPLKPPTWQHWAKYYSGLLGFKVESVLEPIKISTLCSGSDAPVAALGEIVGEAKLRHEYSLDAASYPEKFVMVNFEPAHYFHADISAINDPSAAHCSVCRDQCRAHTKPADFEVAGFPCTPFSTLRGDRWAPEYDPWQQASSRPFLEIAHRLHSSSNLPRAMVLENVDGVERDTRSCGKPLHFIMHGVVMWKGEEKKVGLAFLEPRFHILPLVRMRASAFGLPFVRKRVFWILLRRDSFSTDDVQKILDNLAKIQAHPLEKSPIDSFITDEEEEGIMPIKKRKTLQVMKMTTNSVITSGRVRHAQGLPGVQHPDGQPFQVELLGNPRLHLTSYLLSPREKDCVGVAYLLTKKQHGDVPDDLIVDTSQPVDRCPWTFNGKAPALHTNSRLVYRGKLLSADTLSACLAGHERSSCPSLPAPVPPVVC